MLIQYGQALGDYLYDVFVAKFDFWLAFGLVAQLFFTARFLVQWIASERARKSVVPVSFWWLSMIGSAILLTYFVGRKDFVGMLGYILNIIPYSRNLILTYRNQA